MKPKKEIFLVLTPLQAERLKTMFEDFASFMEQEFAETAKPLTSEEDFNYDICANLCEQLYAQENEYTESDIRKEKSQWEEVYRNKMLHLANNN